MKGELEEKKEEGKKRGLLTSWTMWTLVTFCKRFGKINILGSPYYVAISEILLLNKHLNTLRQQTYDSKGQLAWPSLRLWFRSLILRTFAYGMMVFSWQMAEVQERSLDHTNTFKAFVHVMSANIPFAAKSHMAKPNI